MTDPVTPAYGRGRLPESPTSSDAVIDIVPCDCVVSTVVAIYAIQLKVGEPKFYHYSPGARNPLTFRGIYGHIRSYFSRHPYRDGQGSRQLATQDFPGPEPVEHKLWFAKKGVAIGSRLLSFASRGRKTRVAAQALDKTVKQLDFLDRYLNFHGEHLQPEPCFVDDYTLALHNGLHEGDRKTLGFDSGALDWTHYSRDAYASAIADSVRRLEATRRRRKAHSTTYRDLRATEPEKVLTALDLDGVVMTTSAIGAYLWLRPSELLLTQRAGELMRVAAQLPNYLGAERKDRGVPLRQVYRCYEGTRLDEPERFVDERLTPFVPDQTSPDTARHIREHREAGHTTTLLVGVIRPPTRPFEGLFDRITAVDLATDADEVCTGFLTGPSVVGDSRMAWLTRCAGLYGIDLLTSFTYVDSHVDLPMLHSIGNSVAVSLDIGLIRVVKKSDWSIIEWPSHALQPRRKLPS